MQKKNKPPTNPPQKPKQEVDGKFQLILTLLTLLKNARHKVKKTELEFLIVNQTFNMVPYRHCVYWEWDGESVSVISASGLVQIDPNGPYTLWLKKVIGSILPEKIAAQPEPEGQAQQNYTFMFPVTAEMCGAQEGADWRKWVSGHALMLVMKDREDKVFGGMWIDREQAFGDLETALLEDLGDGYADLLNRFHSDPKLRKARGWRAFFSLSRSNFRRALLVLFVVMLLPVRMSVTAPAEVVARTPSVITVPFDGTIEKVEVLPGAKVAEGDVLVRMDSTMLRNKVEMAASDMLTAEVALSKTEREAFTDKAKLAEIAILKAQLEQKGAEKKFAEEMLARAEIKAEHEGIVIFSDPNALRGKPAQTGEQIMQLARPEDSELLIRVPVESMIRIQEDVPAKFFLNVMPIGSHEARYESIGYQATLDPDGLMTYKIRAKFAGGSESPRIGWTGTGKVYGGHTILAFNILRRPLVTLRRKLGI